MIDHDDSHRQLRNEQRALLLVLSAICFGLILHAWFSIRQGERMELERLPQHEFDFKLDLNTATQVELMQLPGVGETLARRIIADREENGPFSSADDLKRVKGIGPKLTERIRPYVRVRNQEE